MATLPVFSVSRCQKVDNPDFSVHLNRQIDKILSFSNISLDDNISCCHFVDQCLLCGTV